MAGRVNHRYEHLLKDNTKIECRLGGGAAVGKEECGEPFVKR